MALKITDIPKTAVFELLIAFVILWLGHRLAVGREKKKRVLLSSEEKDILIAASKTGRILLMRVDLHGEWVRAGETDFIQTEEPAFAATYLEAFRRLMSRGLVIIEGGAFRLSGTGFAVGRGLPK